MTLRNDRPCNAGGSFLKFPGETGVAEAAGGGTLIPANSRTVGARSTHETIASVVAPRRLEPGAFTTSGRRMPGSYTFVLDPGNAAPLSDRYMTSVLSYVPVRFRASMIVPNVLS